MIGPSGCGKSTLLRTINRINERLGYVRTTGQVAVLGHDVFAADVALCRAAPAGRHGVAAPQSRCRSRCATTCCSACGCTRRAARLGGGARRGARGSLRQVLLWDDVKDRLDARATELSLEEQQKLCIARLLPVKPAILLMDEPCSALDPAGTAAIEELIWDLRGSYTILIVTHNMAQARRASDECVFMLLGRVIEHRPTATCS